MAAFDTARQRYLTIARLVGATALAIVGQIGIDTPQGYFGPVDTLTRFGAAYSLVLLVVTLLLAVAIARRQRFASWLVSTVFSANVGLFLPALAADPTISGVVVLWHLMLLAQQLLPVKGVTPTHGALPSSELDGWLGEFGAAIRHLAFLSGGLTVAVVGYRFSGHPIAATVCLILGYGTLALTWRFVRLLHARGQRGVYVLLLLTVASLLAAASLVVMLSLLALAEAVLLILLMVQQHTTLEVLRSFYAHPSRLIALSFLGTIIIGTVLLTFPAVAAGSHALRPIDALFTATSATCVTGLIVLDTPHDLSFFGQLVVLTLIQLGGLGIMTLSTFGTLMLGGSLGLRGERALTEMLDLQHSGTALRLTRFIVLFTLAVEAIGAIGLTFSYLVSGLDWRGAVWRGLFHSVSAFCNAGFALQSDSVLMFQRQPWTLLWLALLIILGGLGFMVMSGVWSHFRESRSRPLNLQAKVVLTASAILLFVGTALFAATEWSRSLAGIPPHLKLVNALFQSVTLRTAGFNSVELSNIAPATVVFMMVFMFIGASPGSTGGGIKTTTAAVLMSAIRSTLRPGEPIKLFDREVPKSIVLRSLAIAVTSTAIVTMGMFLLLVFENQPFEALLFEAFSAFGTVGLSLGATSALEPIGKLIVIGVMFVGRTGPLTLALFLGTGAARSPVARYPESRLMVG